MATEILNLEVKSNIKGAVKDVDKLGTSVQTAAERYEELNENVAIQNEYIATQETELIRLKEIQDSIPKGAWHAGQSQLADNIREVTSEIRSEKDALKNLKKEQKDVAKAIRDKTSAQKKDTNAAIRGIQHYQIMGVSIRQLKFMVRGVIPMFKLLFGTIKSGIASTGIGLLLLAVASIGTAMSKSVAGGKAFKVMMDGIGKVTGVLIGSLTVLGDLMLSVFGFDSSTSAAVTAAENLEQAYIDLGREMDNINLKKAQGGREELKNQQIIDDITKSEKERIDAAKANYKITSQNNADNLILKKATLKADREAIKLNEVKINDAIKAREGLKEARDKENELVKAEKKTQGELAAIRLKMDKDRIDGVNTINKIKQTQIDKDKQAEDDADKRSEKRNQKRIQDDKDKLKASEDFAKAQLRLQNSIDVMEINDKQLKADKILEIQLKAEEKSIEAMDISEEKKLELMKLLAERKVLLLKENADRDAAVTLAASKELADKEIAAEETVEKTKEQIRAQNLNSISAGIGLIKQLAGENKEIMAAAIIAENAMGIAKTVINTQAGNMAAMSQGIALAIPSGGTSLAAATSMVASNNIAMGLSIATSVAAAAQGLSALGKGGATGGGGATPSVSSSTPAPQMMSGSFELGGGQEVEPVQAYVVSDDITDSQNSLAIIRRRATI
jgi:hypothetical protein|tara:strand:- start:45 stop:2072 length:2028 start_codon:yes stop_codon:yes gene_type:complete